MEFIFETKIVFFFTEFELLFFECWTNWKHIYRKWHRRRLIVLHQISRTLSKLGKLFKLLLTSFVVSLNVVVMMSIPCFLSVLLSSVSPTVLTVIVEFPSTKPKDETADFSWLTKFDVKRNRNRGLDFFIVFLTFERNQQNKNSRRNIIGGVFEFIPDIGNCLFFFFNKNK